MTLANYLNDSVPEERIVIIGAGIVGSCLASHLSTSGDYPALSASSVILIDRDIEGLPGSTGHAPGYVGAFNQIPALTALAKRSVAHYRAIPGGFSTVGGLEVAQSSTGLDGLKERCEKTKAVGLQAQIVDEKEVVEKAPFFVQPGEATKGGLWFQNDGTANAQLIARHQQNLAKQNGVTLLNADVHDITFNSASGLQVVQLKPNEKKEEEKDSFEASKVILCTGIWTSSLAAKLPIVPVAHPYTYTADRKPRELSTPFVRYPESHVYVRDHGPKDGLGSYAHDPIAVASSALTHSAYGEWHKSFEEVLQTALNLLPAETRDAFTSVNPELVGKERAFNGLFSVTPDGMPLVGKLTTNTDTEGENEKGKGGLWVASAVWVTHAAGCAHLVADLLMDKLKKEDEWLADAVNPNRFQGRDGRELEKAALGTYNDIYNKSVQH